MRRTLLPILLLVAVLQPAMGWAASGPGRTPGDPWERVNRRIFAFNQGLDRVFIKPLSQLSNGLTPGPVGRAIHNFLVNLNEPVVIVNDLLQAKPGPAVRSAFRLFINTTAGGLGAIDVAHALHVPAQINGFGDTLGRWGIGPGPYVVLPLFGPATVRDTFGMMVDDATEPVQFVNYPYRTEVDITVNFVGGLNERETIGRDLDALLLDATDPYATLRSAYLQSREAQIRGEKALPVLPDIADTPSAGDKAPAPQAGQTPSAPPTVPAASAAPVGADATASAATPAPEQPDLFADTPAPAAATPTQKPSSAADPPKP